MSVDIWVLAIKESKSRKKAIIKVLKVIIPQTNRAMFMFFLHIV